MNDEYMDDDEYFQYFDDMLFTPFINEFTKVRAYLHISEEDYRRYAAIPKDSEESVWIYDLVSEQLLRVKHTDCGDNDCPHGGRCAAVIISELPGVSRLAKSETGSH